MGENTSLGSLGEAKVLIRVDWEQLEDDLKNSKSKISSAFEQSGKLMSNVGTALTAGLTAPLIGLTTVSTLAASRVNELELVNTQLGLSAGYTEAYIREQENSVQDMGIEAAASREIIADYIKAELDLADASKIARVAQDAAVISGENSTDTTKTLTQAIITGRSELFKSAGMIVDLNSAYREYAELTGDATRELTEQEKVQARVNMTLEYGEKIQGTYLAAMKDPGKVLRSYPRYLNDIAVAFGQNFIPAFSSAIFAGNDFLAWLKEAVSEGGALSPVIEKWGDRFSKAGETLGEWTDRLDEMDPAMLQSIADFIAMGAAMGPVLLVGGKLLTWIPKAVSGFNALAGSLGLTATGLGAVLLPLGMLAAAGISLKVFYDRISENTRSAEENDVKLMKLSATYEGYVARVKIANGDQTRMNTVIWDTNDALAAGFNQLEDYSNQIDVSSRAMWYFTKYGEEIAEKTQDWADSNYESEDAAIAAQAAIDQLRISTEAYEDAIDSAMSFSGNFSGIVSLAKSFDQIMGEINDKQAELNQLQAIMDTGGYIDGVWISAGEARDKVQGLNEDIQDLQVSMDDLANQFVLDMFMATISVDGVMKSEAEAYFQMAADMGIISEEAAAKAIEVYGNAVDQINNKSLKDKNATYTVNIEYKDPLGFVTGSSQFKIGTNSTVQQRAGGGDVLAGVPYLVGEKGPEIYTPEARGSILSTSDTIAAFMNASNQKNNQSRGGDVIVHAIIKNEIDMHKFARIIAEEMRRGA